MDLFPIVLTNRDMDTLMRLIEEDTGTTLPNIPGMDSKYDIDAVKGQVSQLDSRQMREFLDSWERSLVDHIDSRRRTSREPLQYVRAEPLDYLLRLRKKLGIVKGLRDRARRPR